MKQLIYLDLLFFSLLVFYVYDKTKGIVYKNFIYYIFMFFFIIAVSIRFDIGPDYYNYVVQFEYALSKFYHSSSDYIFFNYLSDLFSFHSRGYLGVFFIYFSLTFFLIMQNLKNKKILFYGIFIFFTFGFFFGSLDRIRQYLAISVFLLAFDDILKNNFKAYFLKIIIASFFHLSALLLLLLYFLVKIKINKIIIVICYIILLYGWFTDLWMNLLPKIYTIVPYYNEIYYDPKYFEVEKFNSGLGLIGKSIIVMIILLCSSIHNKYKMTLFIGLSIFLIGAGNLNITRISDYFLSVLILSFPLFMLEKNSSLLISIVKIFLIISLLILYMKDINRVHYDIKTIFSREFNYEKFEPRN